MRGRVGWVVANISSGDLEVKLVTTVMMNVEVCRTLVRLRSVWSHDTNHMSHWNFASLPLCSWPHHCPPLAPTSFPFPLPAPHHSYSRLPPSDDNDDGSMLELLAVLYPAQWHCIERLACIVWLRRRRHGTGWHNSLLQILCASECFSLIICAYILLILQIWLSNAGIQLITVSTDALLQVLLASKCSSSHTCSYM